MSGVVAFLKIIFFTIKFWGRPWKCKSGFSIWKWSLTTFVNSGRLIMPKKMVRAFGPSPARYDFGPGRAGPDAQGWPWASYVFKFPIAVAPQQ
jgi:hypothetical protein